MIGVNLAVHGVGVDVEGDDAERVGMHEERVTLGVVDGHGAVGTQGVACVLVILAVVARQLIAVDGVHIHTMKILPSCMHQPFCQITWTRPKLQMFLS